MLRWLFGRSGPIRVIDGDTVERDGVRFRLMGFDSPDIQNPNTETEWQEGEDAAKRLQQLIAPPNKVRLRPHKTRDRFGRVLAQLFINGRDVKDIAIAEGWGVEFNARKGEKRWGQRD
jgi:endonuclease YncB( thermonuclease family)